MVSRGRHKRMAGGLPSCLHAKLATNEGAESVFDFGMPWNRCAASGLSVGVDVVAATRPFEMTSRRNESPEELPPLHAGTRIAFVCARLRGDPCSFIIME